jgi:XTP/dITP diphosphohydrolase
VFATHNAKKGRELEELARSRFEVRTLKDVGLADLGIAETGEAFATNARLKVDAVVAPLSPEERARTYAVVGDDSGLLVDAIGGRPGVRSARFASDAGTGAGDDANNRLLLLLLEAVPDAMRTARFLSAVCARILDTGAIVEAQGTVEGKIARELSGSGGFGYDPLFIVEGTSKRMAELTAAEKHAISHRGRAMRALLAKLTP